MTQACRLLFALKALDCFFLQLSHREGYLITTHIFSPWYLQSIIQLLSFFPVCKLFPFLFARPSYLSWRWARCPVKARDIECSRGAQSKMPQDSQPAGKQNRLRRLQCFLEHSQIHDKIYSSKFLTSQKKIKNSSFLKWQQNAHKHLRVVLRNKAFLLLLLGWREERLEQEGN